MDTISVFSGIDDYMAAFAPYMKRAETKILSARYSASDSTVFDKNADLKPIIYLPE